MIETLTASQTDNIRKIDKNIDIVKALKPIPNKTDVDVKSYNDANNEVFNAYWQTTREIRLVEGETKIIIDREMISVCNTLLDQKGFKQWR